MWSCLNPPGQCDEVTPSSNQFNPTLRSHQKPHSPLNARHTSPSPLSREGNGFSPLPLPPVDNLANCAFLSGSRYGTHAGSGAGPMCLAGVLIQLQRNSVHHNTCSHQCHHSFYGTLGIKRKAFKESAPGWMSVGSRIGGHGNLSSQCSSRFLLDLPESSRQVPCCPKAFMCRYQVVDRREYCAVLCILSGLIETGAAVCVALGL